MHHAAAAYQLTISLSLAVACYLLSMLQLHVSRLQSLELHAAPEVSLLAVIIVVKLLLLLLLQPALDELLRPVRQTHGQAASLLLPLLLLFKRQQALKRML
jgi:hypothetical protein